MDAKNKIDTRERIVLAVRQEIQQMGKEIKDEISELRRESREDRESMLETIKDGVSRQALSILGLVGVDEDTITTWLINRAQRRKGKRKL